MMKKIVIAVAISMTMITTASAQAIKIKKGTIFLDDKEIGTVKEEKNKNKLPDYHFYDTQGKELFSSSMNKLKDTVWQTISVPEYGAADMPYEIMSFSLNETKLVTELLIKKYKFYESGSWSITNAKAYIDSHHEKIGDQVRSAENQMSATLAANQVAAKEMNIRVLPSGVIMAYENTVLGRIPELKQEQNGYSFVAYNAANKIKFGAYPDNTISGVKYVVKTNVDVNKVEYDPNTYRLPLQNATKSQMLPMVQAIVSDLANKGYWSPADTLVTVGGEKVMANGSIQNVQDFSTNIVNQPGTMITTDGETVPGKINVEFVQKEQNGITSLDFGIPVSIWYINEKGKERLKKFKLKDLKGFQVGDRKFDIIPCKGLLGSGRQIGELVYEGAKAKLYKVNLSGRYSIMFKANDVEDAVWLDDLVKANKRGLTLIQKCAEFQALVIPGAFKADEDDGKKLVDAYCK